MKKTLLKSGVMFLAFAIGIAAAGMTYINLGYEDIGEVPLDQPQPDIKVPKTIGPTVEMVFVLDTTGSMGGLLDGAKQKIWGIINEVMQRSSNPSVRVGFVAYRDIGDDYVTQITPLTTDLDAFYIKLMELKPGGGGDFPENVQRALADGVEKAGWASDSSAKILFLVGDAPPKKYKNEADIMLTTAKALQNNMIVNTIQCGEERETKAVWEKIAKAGQGKYFAIAQDGGVETVETPYDAEIAALGEQMGDTFVPYGSSTERQVRSESLHEARSVANTSAPSAQADRALNKAISKEAYNGDLLQDLESGKKNIDEIAEAELPEDIQKMSPSQRKENLSQKLESRKKLRGEIVELSKKRDGFIKEKALSSGKQSGFDSAVSAALSEQLGKLGVK